MEFIDVLLFRDGNINKSNGLKNKSWENESYECNYIKGKYGVILFLGDFEDFFFEYLVLFGYENEG